MKIIVPTRDTNGLASSIEHHFGRAPFYAVVDRDTRALEFVPNCGSHHGGNRTPAQILVDLGADIVICAGMGPKAVNILRDGGVKVLTGAKNTLAETLNSLDAGDLVAATEENACKDHRH